MKLDSKYFDCIRVKPDKDRVQRDQSPRCDWEGCNKPGPYPAPRGRGREGQYLHFCLDHVRQYNKSYNYFAGMSDEDIATYQTQTVTGHRPTWSMGVNSGARNGTASNGNQQQERRSPYFMHGFSTDDAFGLFGQSTLDTGARKPQRTIRNVERKCLRALGLDDTATPQEIKSSFKALVKLHHPDSNGGDRRSEDKLRDVIQAYNYLKQVGLC